MHKDGKAPIKKHTEDFYIANYDYQVNLTVKVKLSLCLTKCHAIRRNGEWRYTDIRTTLAFE
jgi:hypothetical protein